MEPVEYRSRKNMFWLQIFDMSKIQNYESFISDLR